MSTSEKKAGNPMFIAMMAVLLVGNLIGTVFVAVKVIHPAKVEETHAAAEIPGAGPVVAIDPFVVNLNEPGSTRFLKANFEVQVLTLHAQEELLHNKRSVRDDLLRYLSGLTVADTLGEAGKAKIRDEVTARIDKALGGGRVHKVYFTEFVVQ